MENSIQILKHEMSQNYGFENALCARKPCIHHLKGHIEYRMCDREYRCSSCEFDQYFQDQYRVHTVMSPVHYHKIDGISFPTGYYLAKGHAWVKLEEENETRVGIDDFVLRLLGTPDHIELPLIGTKAVKGEPLIRIFREGNSASILSPVNGVVTAVNRDMLKEKGAANLSPYCNGWMVMVHCDSLRNDMKDLLFMEESRSYLKQHIEDLYEILEAETGLMAADGGNLGDDIYGNAPGLEWDRLVECFLKQ
ncbi:MAG: glycine cleavage system protein H [Desulfamplus sp.]|nr:glycine cleavage system protein H [Desulfamplus sp.]